MKSNIQRISIIVLTLMLLLIPFKEGLVAAAVLPKSSYEFYVYDEANILDSTTEEYIIEVNKELYKKTGAQIVVATINSLESMDINRYATALFEEWKIGSREYDNGLLVLVVPSEKELWIEVGYGLEGPLPDSRIKRIIDNSMVPSFANNDYNTGILLGFNNILDYLETEYNIELDTRNHIQPDYIEEDYYQASPAISFAPFIILLIFILVDFIFFKGLLTRSILRALFWGGPRGPRGPRGGGGFPGGGFPGGGGFSGGGGSRGGGGRSGGGGAGGSW